MTLAIILLSAAALIILLLIIPLGVGIKYENGVFFIFKIAFFSFDVPLKGAFKRAEKKNKKKTKGEKKQPSPEKALDRGIVGIDFLLSVFGDTHAFVRRHFSLKGFDLEIELGTNDAAATAVSVGALWGISCNLLALIDRLVCVKKPHIDIKPRFNTSTFTVKAQGIIVARPVHIIAVSAIFVYKYLQYKNNKED